MIKNINSSLLLQNNGQIDGLPKNPRFIKDEKYKKLVKSLKDDPEMLQLRELIVYPYYEKYVVICGNMRLNACIEIGINDIPCKVLDNNTTIEKLKAYTIKDNIGYGEHDFDLLANEWDAEKLIDWGVDLPDFENNVKEVEEDDFEEEGINIDTNIKVGDMFKIGRHTLLCGDSTKSEFYEKLLCGEKADLIFTDPPYDLEDSYSTHIFSSAKDDCHIFIMNSDKLLIDNVNNGKDIFRKFFAVDFRQARLVSNNQPMTRVDLIAEFLKGKTKFNNLFDGFSTLIECANIHNNNETINFGHKQAKKIELPATFISHYSNENELVCDFFGGSGSTMAACEQLNRICKSIEFDPVNCQIIINRMEKCYNLKAEKI